MNIVNCKNCGAVILKIENAHLLPKNKGKDFEMFTRCGQCKTDQIVRVVPAYEVQVILRKKKA